MKNLLLVLLATFCVGSTAFAGSPEKKEKAEKHRLYLQLGLSAQLRWGRTQFPLTPQPTPFAISKYRNGARFGFDRVGIGWINRMGDYEHFDLHSFAFGHDFIDEVDPITGELQTAWQSKNRAFGFTYAYDLVLDKDETKTFQPFLGLFAGMDYRKELYSRVIREEDMPLLVPQETRVVAGFAGVNLGSIININPHVFATVNIPLELVRMGGWSGKYEEFTYDSNGEIETNWLFHSTDRQFEVPIAERLKIQFGLGVRL